MKGEIKNKYIEYVDHIDFPAMLYVYESNKMIAINGYAKEMVGGKCDDVRELFEGKKFKLTKDIMQGDGKLYKKVIVTCLNGETIAVDMDINVIKVDNVHFVLLLFEESSKDKFHNMSVHVPRVAWMYHDVDEIYMNESLKSDINIDNEGNEVFDVESYLSDSMLDKMSEIKKSIITDGVTQYNSIQMIVKRDESNHFIKVNRMPIINNAGEYVGILNIHNIILDKESNRKVYDNVLQDATKKKQEEKMAKVKDGSMEKMVKSIPDRIDLEKDVKNYIIDAIEHASYGTMIMFSVDNYEHIKYEMGALYSEELSRQFEEIIVSDKKLAKKTYMSRANEYVVVLSASEKDKLEQVIELINKKFNGKRKLKDKKVNCEINMGITHFPKDGIKCNLLMKNMEYAIYEAKNDEGTNYRFYGGNYS